MGNSNSRSRLTRSFEQFDPVAPLSTPAPDALHHAILPPLGRPSSKSLLKVVPSPDSDDAIKRPVNQLAQHDLGDELESRAPSTDSANNSSGSSSTGISITTTAMAGAAASFDFSMTEGQTRRTLMAECEFECSQILPFLFVGGVEIAKSWQTLQQHDITYVINCSASVVESHFAGREEMRYLSLSMVDGRQDDIGWFFCEVCKFIESARCAGARALLHCEKGISRSCSFAIAYRMWSAQAKWKDAFDFVKAHRTVCSPNTAFTCNLMEIGDLMHAKSRGSDLLLRLAVHLPHDPDRLVLKTCRHADSRKLLPPSSTRLDPRGVFVIRPRYAVEEGGPGAVIAVRGAGKEGKQVELMEEPEVRVVAPLQIEDIDDKGNGDAYIDGIDTEEKEHTTDESIYIWHGRGVSPKVGR